MKLKKDEIQKVAVQLSYRLRLLIVLANIGVLTAGELLFKQLLLPDSFGDYGPYQADTIREAAHVPIRHGTNAPCFNIRVEIRLGNGSTFKIILPAYLKKNDI